ncbi:MAG: GAF domain-containing protein [Candidatus Omnitrophica bacterium]|nr:GAF domain-containing protein [Candidatus Omnitrophota bacterium]
MYAIPPLITAIYFITIGLVVYLNNRHSNVNRSFLYLCISTFIWQFSWFLLFSRVFYNHNLLIIKLGYSGIIFIPVSFYHFLSNYSNLPNRGKGNTITTNYFIGVILGIFLWYSSLFINGYNSFSWGVYPKAGILHPVYLLFLLILTLKGIHISLLSYANADYSNKNKAKYILLSLCLYIPASFDFVTNYGVAIYPVGFVFVLLSFGVIAYAIIKHHLLDIYIVIKKTLVFAGLFFGFYVLFSLALFLNTSLLKGLIENKLLATIPSVVLFIFLYRPIENWLVNITDRFLFQKKYDYLTLLRSISDDLLTILNLKELANITANKLKDIMRLSNACFFALDNSANSLKLLASSGDFKNTFPVWNCSKGFNDTLFSKPYHVSNSDTVNQSSDLRSFCDQYKCKIIIPLSRKKEKLGVLTLGNKLSDEDFTPDDINIVLYLANYLSLAIVNAKQINELHKANAALLQQTTRKRMNQMAEGMSHQFNNRFVSIAFPAGLAKMYLADIDTSKLSEVDKKRIKDSLYAVERIEDNSARGGEIAKGLLNFNKMSQHTFEQVNIRKGIDLAIEMIQYKHIDFSHIELSVDIADDMPLINSNIAYLQEVFFIILDNSYDAIKQRILKDNSFVGDIKINVRYLHDLRTTHIEVSDTGEGMKPEILDKIRDFVPYVTTKASSATSGYGAGVNVLKRYVDILNGDIDYESTFNEGTKVIIDLPFINGNSEG